MIDGFGAIISAVMLGIVLVKFEEYFGIPKSTLYFLASLSCFFAIYDFYSYLKIENKLAIFLKRIAIVNIIYCFLSIGVAFYHHERITYLGWSYVVLEIIIVLTIALIELKAVNNYNKKLI